MRYILVLENFLFMFFLLISCSSNESKIGDKKRVKIEQVENLKLDNPALFMGSSFGEFLQACHKIGDYQKMLDFTSSATRKEFGDSLLLFFKNMQFSYPLRLKAMKEENGQITLFYQTKIEQTNKTIQMLIILEQDSCKLFLSRLATDKPFIGM